MAAADVVLWLQWSRIAENLPGIRTKRFPRPAWQWLVARRENLSFHRWHSPC